MPDIDHIRQELNEHPFQDGTRRVFVGKISEMFDEESEQTIDEHLRDFESELRHHTLIMSRNGGDRDDLFVVQELRSLSLDFSWMAEATNWVTRTTTVALEMVLPGLAGWWLDNRFGTRYLVWLGFALGVPLGIRHLIAMTESKRDKID